MNAGDPRTRRRIERILQELRAGDLDQSELADRIVINRGESIREYVKYVIEKKIAHVVDWRKRPTGGPYIRILRFGPGVNVPKPAPKTRAQIKADYRAKLLQDKERYEKQLRRSRLLRRKPPKPDEMLAWVFKPKGEENGNERTV